MLMDPLWSGREESRITPRFWSEQLQGGIFCLQRWGKAVVWSSVLDLVSCRCPWKAKRSCPRQPAFRDREAQRGGPGLDGPGVGEGGNYMQIVCLLVLSWVGDPHWILRGSCDPENGRPSAWRAVL